jgi:hypothetical protein
MATDAARGGAGRNSTSSEMSQESENTSGCPRKVTFDGLSRRPSLLLRSWPCRRSLRQAPSERRRSSEKNSTASSLTFSATRQRSKPRGRASCASIPVRPTRCSNTPESSWRVELSCWPSLSPLIPITFSRMRMGCVGMPRRKQRIRPHSSSIVARPSFAQISVGHDGRALATDVLKALDNLPR